MDSDVRNGVMVVRNSGERLATEREVCLAYGFPDRSSFEFAWSNLDDSEKLSVRRDVRRQLDPCD